MRVNLLFTLDSRYIGPLKVLLTSLRANNPGISFSFFLAESGMEEECIREIETWCGAYGAKLSVITLDGTLFESAPVSRQYPKEMYYRLLAPSFLPEGVDRILYLDPDILCINPLSSLWEIDMQGNIFAAASHTGIAEIANGVNRLRLGIAHDYCNSGVILIDVERARAEIRPSDILSYAEKHQSTLILPDQDVLNALYGNKILSIDDAIWNYDARKYSSYIIRSSGAMDTRWVMENTVFLHFCGKAKPWKKSYAYRYGVLYQHYKELSRREWSNLAKS